MGSRLTDMLVARGHSVVHVSRAVRSGSLPTYAWNVAQGTMDERAFEGVTTVVHLAGAGVADARWTPERKKEILDSRVKSTLLLKKALAQQPQVTTVVAASAIGYYGFGTSAAWLTEESEAGSDFLADVTRQWEATVEELSDTGVRVVKLRIGIVLSAKGGALKEIAKPVRWGVGAPLGTGAQWMSWIHLDDLCAIFIYAIENPHLRGTYNAVGPEPATNREMTKAIAHVLRKPLWLPPVPGVVLQLLVGEMAAMVLNGSRVSPAKIIESGFSFQYPELSAALKNLLE